MQAGEKQFVFDRFFSKCLSVSAIKSTQHFIVTFFPLELGFLDIPLFILRLL